jgi:hypothetical protein
MYTSHAPARPASAEGRNTDGALALEQPVLRDLLGGLETEVLVGARGGLSAFGDARQEAKLQQERLVDVLERVGILAHCGGEGVEAHGAAAERVNQRLQDRRRGLSVSKRVLDVR